MKYKTEAYPKDGEVVITEINVTYSQESELSNEFNDLKLSIDYAGAGFYFVMETERWAFDKIEDLENIIKDFKAKANI
jgi:hypothetical protein